MIGIQTSNDTYYAILFHTTEQRDAAIGTLNAQPFVDQGTPIPLHIQAFGNMSARPNIIWHIPAGLIYRPKDVRAAVIAHCLRHHPTFSSTFEVRAKKDGRSRTGEFYVRFNSPPPPKFIKQMSMDDDLVLISQEPLYLCRFCNTSGHTIFQCTNGSPKSLSKAVAKGSVGNSDTSTLPDDTTTFEDTIAKFKAEEQEIEMGEQEPEKEDKVDVPPSDNEVESSDEEKE
jgi:hypothetical protein